MQKNKELEDVIQNLQKILEFEITDEHFTLLIEKQIEKLQKVINTPTS